MTRRSGRRRAARRATRAATSSACPGSATACVATRASRPPCRARSCAACSGVGERARSASESLAQRKDEPWHTSASSGSATSAARSRRTWSPTGTRSTVYDTDAGRRAAAIAAGAHGAARRRGGGARERDHVHVAADAGDVRARWRRSGWRAPRRARSWSISPPTRRRLVRASAARLAAAGRHLLEAPLTGGAPGAQARMLVFMVGGDAAVVRARAAAARAARARHLSRRRARARQRRQAGQQPDGVLRHLGLARRARGRGQGGHRPAHHDRRHPHRRRRQHLHRPHGRGHQRARPADAVLARAGRQGRRPAARRRARARRADAGRRRRSRRRSSPPSAPASASATSPTSSS